MYENFRPALQKNILCLHYKDQLVNLVNRNNFLSSNPPPSPGSIRKYKHCLGKMQKFAHVKAVDTCTYHCTSNGHVYSPPNSLLEKLQQVERI